MNFLDRYINNFCDKQLESKYSDDNDIIVVIPCYDESLETISETLNSLDVAYQTNDELSIHVMVLINYKQSDNSTLKEDSRLLYEALSLQTYGFTMDIFMLEFKESKGGVGLARKCLMDCALRKFYSCNKNGLIVNLDADTLVSINYFSSINSFFQENENAEAASISFKHRNHNEDKINRAIVDYELHLRYYINMQRLSRLPYAFQTVGSAMVVRSDAYAKEGGMPKKQAGEDFYFLHKYTKKNSLGEINSTTVYPASRISQRVPFGTGKAVGDIINANHTYNSYHYTSFEVLSNWINLLMNSYENWQKDHELFPSSEDDALGSFLTSHDVKDKVLSILSNTTSIESFTKRFFQWFDAFMLMKYLHFMREAKYKNLPIDECIDYLFDKLNIVSKESKFAKLKALRSYDMQADFSI